MAKKIRVWDGSAWQDVAPSLPYTAIHSAQTSMPLTGVDGQVWLDTDGTLADTGFVPLTGGTMTGNLNVPSINSGGITGQNYIINGAFDHWQRGTSISGTGYSADRWYAVQASGQSNLTVSRQSFTPGNTISGYESAYYGRFSYTGTASGYFWMTTRLEDVRTLAGQTVTLSFWAKGTNSVQFLSQIQQNFGSGGSSAVESATDTMTLSTTWQRFSQTFVIPSISGKTVGTSSYLEIRPIQLAPGVGSNDYDIWGVKLEAGSQATPFIRAGSTIQEELAACQRYYYRETKPSTGSALIGPAYARTASISFATWIFPVTMRSIPTLAFSNNTQDFNLQIAGGDATFNTLSGSSLASTTRASLRADAGSYTIGQAGVLGFNNANAWIEASAEL